MDLEKWRDQHPLEGPFIKLKRAEKHLETIDQYLAKFDSLAAHGVSFELDDEKSFYQARLHALFPPFIDFWTIIGEFCYQVRSSLDHLVYAVSEFPSTLTEKELAKAERDTAFPISLERQKSDAGVRGRLRSVPQGIREEVFKVVDRYQPYQRGDREAAFDDALALLDELSNLDKHRIFKMLEVNIKIDLIDLAPGIRTIQATKANDGQIFAWIPAHLDPEAAFLPRVKTQVVLPVKRHGGHVHIESLRAIHNRARNDILPEFKQFFGPLPVSVVI
jgi:hypothetical protein